jgi:hypothetical protein
MSRRSQFSLKMPAVAVAIVAVTLWGFLRLRDMVPYSIAEATMPRPQFAIRAFLAAMLAVVAFFGGMLHFRTVVKRRADARDSLIDLKRDISRKWRTRK